MTAAKYLAPTDLINASSLFYVLKSHSSRMGKRKREQKIDEEASRVVQRRKSPDLEPESSTDEESLALSPQVQSRDRIRAYKGDSEDEILSDLSESVSSKQGSSSAEDEGDSEDEEPAGANHEGLPGSEPALDV